MKIIIALLCFGILHVAVIAGDALLSQDGASFFAGSLGYKFGEKNESQVNVTYIRPKEYAAQGGCKFFGVDVGGRLAPRVINYPKKSKDLPSIVWGQALPSPQKWTPPFEEPRFFVKNREMFPTINEIGVILRFNSVASMKDAAVYYGQYFGMFDEDFTAKNPPSSMGQASGKIVMVQAPAMFEDSKTKIARYKFVMGDNKRVVYLEYNSKEQTVTLRVVDESM